MIIFWILLFIFTIFLEGTVTTLPMVLVGLLCLTIMKREPIVFVFAFLSGLILDLLTLHPIGLSSLYFIFFVFLIFLYQRKYEINSYPFVAASAFAGAFIFLIIVGGGNLFIDPLLSSIIALLLFGLTRIFYKYNL